MDGEADVDAEGGTIEDLADDADADGDMSRPDEDVNSEVVHVEADENEDPPEPDEGADDGRPGTDDTVTEGAIVPEPVPVCDDGIKDETDGPSPSDEDPSVSV